MFCSRNRRLTYTGRDYVSVTRVSIPSLTSELEVGAGPFPGPYVLNKALD